jgi:hypothetical protein
MEDECEFDDAKIGSKVPAPANTLHRVDQEFADFARELIQFLE